MKNLFNLVVVLATSAVLSGCLFGKKEEAAAPAEAPAMEAAAPTEAAPADAAAPAAETAPTEAAPTEGTSN